MRPAVFSPTRLLTGIQDEHDGGVGCEDVRV